MDKRLKNLLRTLSLVLVCICTNINCNSQGETESITATPQSTETWNLVFEDDFDRDLSQWNAWNSGAFNEEIQLYRPNQLNLDNGILRIHVQREAVTGMTHIFDETPKSFEYVSGRIESKELFGPSDKEGEREYRFTARIKLPKGHGMWPAFWTYGHPWPTQGEIDILEARGGRPNEYLTNLFFGTEPSININEGADVLHELDKNLTSEFHEYEMIWTAETIEIRFDGETLHLYEANTSNNIKEFFGKKQMVVLNTAVGGIFFDDRNSENYANTSVMEIDWVKVYKR